MPPHFKQANASRGETKRRKLELCACAFLGFVVPHLRYGLCQHLVLLSYLTVALDGGKGELALL